jgi:hypothetical protein
VHSEDKCYLGRVEDFLGDLLVKIREGQKREKNEGKEQQELAEIRIINKKLINTFIIKNSILFLSYPFSYCKSLSQ